MLSSVYWDLVRILLLHPFLLEPKHRKKKYCPIPDAASERVYDADKHFNHSDYRADGIGQFLFFRLYKIYKLLFSMKNPNGIQKAEYGYSCICKYCDPHICKSEKSHDHNNNFNRKCKYNVLP